jgi:TatA/E family protein of Tat protein translocase
MFGSLGMPELILILVIALIVFGPKKLPEVGRSLGKAMREFKRTTEEIKGKFEEQINAEEFKDIKSDLADIKKEISGTFELPNEIKDLTRDLNAPLDAPPPAAAPAPSSVPAPPVGQAEPAAHVEPPTPADESAIRDAAKDGTSHGEG